MLLKREIGKEMLIVLKKKSMTKKSAGILLFRKVNSILEIFLVHPGGPFWQKKDLGAWSIPKGEFADEEDVLIAAKREFLEETGTSVTGEFIELTLVRQKSGKLIYAWAVQGDIDSSTIKSNNFEMQWPPKSGLIKSFPEIDKGEWFSIDDAKHKINPSQISFIDELIGKVK